MLPFQDFSFRLPQAMLYMLPEVLQGLVHDNREQARRPGSAPRLPAVCCRPASRAVMGVSADAARQPGPADCSGRPACPQLELMLSRLPCAASLLSWASEGRGRALEVRAQRCRHITPALHTPCMTARCMPRAPEHGASAPWADPPASAGAHVRPGGQVAGAAHHARGGGLGAVQDPLRAPLEGVSQQAAP